MASLMTPSPSVCLVFLTLLYVLNTTSMSMQLCHPNERSALLQFKHSFSINTSSSGYSTFAYPKVESWKSRDCCLWDGVECDKDTGHVTVLDLSSSCLYGSLNSSNSLFRLVHLQRLNLFDNDFIHSQIPSQFGLLSKLTYLNLSYSGFYGQIPFEIANLFSLTHLGLGGNSLELKRFGLERLVKNLTSLEKLDLSSVNISSTLPHVFANLSSLSYLNLESCNLWGIVPSSLGFLTKLESLYLADNDFSGHIPFWLANFTQLSKLSLSYNNFKEGNLSWLYNLNKLVYLHLSHVNLVGEIPSSLRNMTHLELLYLRSNQLRGGIPLWLSNLTHLTRLHLGENELSGPIPQSISKLVNLEYLNFQFNQLSGTVNFDIFIGLKNLRFLHIPGNNLTVLTNKISSNATFPKFIHLSLGDCNTGEFPEFLRHQDELIDLDLSHNNIEGQIPKWLGEIGRETLSVLLLSDNIFTGFEELSALSLLSNLQRLDLSSNKLQGTLPLPAPSILEYKASENSLTGELSPLLCDLTSIAMLELSSNNLSGVIPRCLVNFSDSLLVLSIANNSFHGSIPDSFTTQCSVRLIDLSGNQLRGQLPKTLAHCRMLESLQLGQNRISDQFPMWLGTLNKLQILSLRSNQFFGSIRTSAAMIVFPALRIIDLAFNNFTGVLPSKFFKHLSGMIAFVTDELEYMEATTGFFTRYVAQLLTFEYQISLANKGTYLEYWKISNVIAAIDLSSNRFQGDIPYSIGSLKMVNVLNLSNNHLSGHIPSALENLTKLESLDLSNNMLSGEIPQQLTQNTFLEYFNVSHNQLVGPIPQGKQFNTFDNSSYEGNLGLCGMPLSKSCRSSEDSPQPQAPSLEEDEDSILPIHIEWIGVVVGYGSGFVIGMVVGWRVIRKNPRWFVKTFGLKRRQPRKRSRQTRRGRH